MKLKISMMFNLIIFILSVLGAVFMFSGFKFMDPDDIFTISGIAMFKFFTIDSNVIMGLIALVFFVFEVRALRGKSIPKYMYLLKLMGTVGVALTFFTVVFYLAPIIENGYIRMFVNANLFFHLIVPVLSMITFMFFENTKELEFKHTFTGTALMFLYAIYYTINVVIHIENGKVSPLYDWYYFIQGGAWTMIIAIPVIFIATYVISYMLWRVNRRTE